jgi:hypothetical protein
MARNRLRSLNALGSMFEIWKQIVNSIQVQGGSDEDMRNVLTVQGVAMKVAAVILGKSDAVLQVAWSALLPWLIAAGKFISYVNPNITTEHFPIQSGDFTIKEVVDVAIPRAMSTAEVLAYLDSKGMRAATLVELLWWWLTNPTKRSNCLVVALGSVWGGYVPGVVGDGSFRSLRLNTLAGDWGEDYAFAAVSK